MRINVSPTGSSPKATSNPSQPTNKVEVSVIRRLADFQKEVLQAQGSILVKFSTAWCDACQETKPHFQEIANRYGDKIKVIEVELGGKSDPRDVDEIGRKYRVFGKRDDNTGEILDYGRGMPALSLFVNGEEIEQFDDFENLDNLVESVEKTIVQTALTKSGI